MRRGDGMEGILVPRARQLAPAPSSHLSCPSFPSAPLPSAPLPSDPTEIFSFENGGGLRVEKDTRKRNTEHGKKREIRGRASNTTAYDCEIRTLHV